MLEQRTFRGTEAEKDAVTALLAEYTEDGRASVTRTEAQETGPLLVHVLSTGNRWLVHEDGRTERVEEVV